MKKIFATALLALLLTVNPVYAATPSDLVDCFDDDDNFIYHEVLIQPGDTLSKLAVCNRTTIENLLQLNPNIENPDRIYAGEKLIVKISFAPAKPPQSFHPVPHFYD